MKKFNGPSGKKTNRKLFINLPVKDLNKSVKFFTKLGFKFNPKFTDKNATSMIINDDAYVMLLVEKFFRRFTKKTIINAKKNTESLTSISVSSRKEVDTMINIAIKNGAKKLMSFDHGWMYGCDFEDLDGHIWELFYMDESKFPKKK